jgi:hypothetical protein
MKELVYVAEFEVQIILDVQLTCILTLKGETSSLMLDYTEFIIADVKAEQKTLFIDSEHNNRCLLAVTSTLNLLAEIQS